MVMVMAAFLAWGFAAREFPVLALTLFVVCLAARHWPRHRGPHF